MSRPCGMSRHTRSGKPKVVGPPAGSGPLYEALLTEALEPLTVRVPFHTWVMVWPLAVVQRTVQPLICAPPAVTVTSPWNPPDHEPTVRYVAAHAGPADRVVGGAVVGGAVVGGAVLG